jgi:hypothetical protein
VSLLFLTLSGGRGNCPLQTSSSLPFQSHQFLFLKKLNQLRVQQAVRSRFHTLMTAGFLEFRVPLVVTFHSPVHQQVATPAMVLH